MSYKKKGSYRRRSAPRYGKGARRYHSRRANRTRSMSSRLRRSPGRVGYRL